MTEFDDYVKSANSTFKIWNYEIQETICDDPARTMMKDDHFQATALVNVLVTTPRGKRTSIGNCISFNSNKTIAQAQAIEYAMQDAVVKGLKTIFEGTEDE